MHIRKLCFRHDYIVIDVWKDDWRIYQQWRCTKCGKEKTIIG